MGYCISANSKECRAFSASVALNYVHKSGTYLIPRIVNILIFCSRSNVLLALPSYSKAHIYYH
jgi:hypothetical protein